jgi:hypothetical protein
MELHSHVDRMEDDIDVTGKSSILVPGISKPILRLTEKIFGIENSFTEDEALFL